MSYLFGIVDWEGQEIPARELGALAEAVGAAGFATTAETSGGCALGYGHRPDRDPHCRIVRHEHLTVLADLRLYDRGALRSRFGAGDDFDAFARAFLHWGEECGRHVNGDFAAVVVDRLNRRAHLLRDHIGARPLVYRHDRRRLLFATHEYGLARSGLFPADRNEEHLLRHFLWLRGDYRQTAFRDVCKVTPGHVVTFWASGQRSTRYWQPGEIRIDRAIRFEEAAGRLRQLLVDATMARVAPGKVGAHVSGGLDSCAVAGILADRLDDRGRLTGYSWTPEAQAESGPGEDERPHLETFSAEKGVPVRCQHLGENEFARDAVRFDFEGQRIEQPTMRAAGSDGVTTLFSGWGGDEFLSLSTRGVFNHLFFGLQPARLLRFVWKCGLRSTLARARTEVLPLLVPFGLHPSCGRTRWADLHLLAPDLVRKHWRTALLPQEKNIFGYGNRRRFILNLLENYHLPERMDAWALHAERHGFEYRYPLLDKDVLEFWFGLPVEFTYHEFDSRRLFREVAKGFLPESIRLRRTKDEARRTGYSWQNLRAGKAYLEGLFDAVPAGGHPPHFRTEAWRRLFHAPLPEAPREGRACMEKLCFYLRQVELARVCLPPGKH